MANIGRVITVVCFEDIEDGIDIPVEPAFIIPEKTLDTLPAHVPSEPIHA